MKKLSLFQAILDAYKKALELLPNEFMEAQRFLATMRMGTGICNYANRVFDTDITDFEEVKKYQVNGSKFWGDTPILAKDVEDIKARLQIRIDNLTKIVEDVK